MLCVRLSVADTPKLRDAQAFQKLLGGDHTRDGGVIMANATNGAQLRLLNSCLPRLVFPS
jgi:hypothetical protein